MVKIKLKAGTLLKVLNLVKSTGKNHKGDKDTKIKDCLIKVSKKDVIIEAGDKTGIIVLSVKIKTVEIIETGEIPIEFVSLDPKIKDSKMLTSLSRYKPKDEVSIEINNGMINILRDKPKLLQTIALLDKSNLTSSLGEDGFSAEYNPKKKIWFGKDSGIEFTTHITINASEFKEIVKDGEQIEHRSYPINIDGDIVMVTVEDQTTHELIEREVMVSKIDNPIKEPINSLFSYGFGNIFSNLSGEFDIWFKHDMPMIIEQNVEDYHIAYVLSSGETEDEDDEVSDKSIENSEQDITDKDLKPEIEDQYDITDTCMNCGEEKNNISAETGNCFKCDNPDPDDEILSEKEEAEIEEILPTLKWAKIRLVKHAKEMGLKPTGKDTKKSILQMIKDKQKE